MAGLERGVRPIGDWSMSMTLSSASAPSAPAAVDLGFLTLPSPPRGGSGGASTCESEWNSTSSTMLFAGAGHAGDAREQASSGNPGGDALRSGFFAPTTPRKPSACARDGERDGHLCRADTDRSARPLAAMMSFGRAPARSSAPVHARPRPQVETWSAARIVSASCSTTTTVVAQVAQAGGGSGAAAGCPSDEADGSLVEDIQHADEPRADLRRQPDALPLPPDRVAAGRSVA